MTLVTCPRCSRQVAGGRFCPGCGARLDDPLTGKILAGRVKLVAQTGRGPFYATYHAEHKNGGTVWLVKVLEPAVSGDDARKRRFLENAGAMMALGDARLLAIREMAEEEVSDGGRPRRVVFAVADGPAGPSLAELIRRQGPLDTFRAAAFGKGMLEALGAVHAAGVVHGDLNPGCVFLEPDGPTRERIRLADAGLAAGLAAPPAEGPDPAALGTDGGKWISPEQAQGQAAGKSSDLHAAGAVLYFALTGTPPWQADKGSSLLFEIQKSVPRPASEMQARVPAALDRVLDKALAKSPAERYRTAAEFVKALADATAGVAAVPRPALPVDVTPGALTMVGMAPPGLADVTMIAPPGKKAPSLDDATIHAQASGGDETLIAPASAMSPPAPPRRADPPPAARPAPPPPRPAPQAEPGTVRAAPAPKPAPAPKSAPTPRPARSAPTPVPAAAEAAPAAAAPAGKPGKSAKTRGPWSVGTPVGVFSILLFLGVGTLYGFVWAGRLDWDLPPWARTLTGRDAIPHLGDIAFSDQKVFAAILNVEVPTEIAVPMEGQGEQAFWGTWRLVKDPAPADSPSKEGEAAPAEKVFASGTLAGPPDPTTGVIPVRLTLPEGRYRLHARLRYGALEDNLVEVSGNSVAKSMKILRDRTQLMVKVTQETGRVKVTRALNPREWVKTVTPEIKAVVFGLDSDGRDGALYFGDRVRVEVSATGYDDLVKENVLLRDPLPQLLEASLQRNPGNRIKLCLTEIARDGTPGPYGTDAEVMADPGVKIALAGVYARNGAEAEFMRLVEDLITTMKGKPLPSGGSGVMVTCDGMLGFKADEAVARGDLDGVRLARRRARALIEFLPAQEAEPRRRAWAEREVRAWLNYPTPPVENGSAPDPERPLVEGMVTEDLKLLAADDPAAAVRQDVARRILEHRAWAAWRAGNDLRPRTENEPPAIPGPAVKPWMDIAVKAWPGIEDTLSYQRLAARLEDLFANPRAAVALLLAEKEWGHSKVLPGARLDMLPRKDRLLLARALKRWGDLRQGDETKKEAEALWRHAWDVYQRCVGRNAEGETGEYPDTLVQEARFEAAVVAALVKDQDTALKAWDDYIALNPEDAYARRRRDALARTEELAPGEQMRILGYLTVLIPGGPFRVGADSVPAVMDERPFSDGTIVQVNQLASREVLFEDYLIGENCVTVGQYLEYLKAMEDPERARGYRHPQEPEEISKRPDARRPLNLAKWSKDEPVRDVSWWDAWACARFLGGRLPTEAEWEKAALWTGRRTPYPWSAILEELREAAGPSWTGYWPDNAVKVCVFDRAPSGAVAFLGGVSEWTMDSFVPRTAGSREGMGENTPEVPPAMPAKSAEVMCVRGGSFYHRPPGEAPRESPPDKDDPPPPATKGGTPPPPRPTLWRAMNLMERRGVPAGRPAKWIGFRVVVGTKASEKPR